MVHTQLTQASAVCLIGEGGTPVFTTDGIDESYYGNGLYFSLQASDNRILADHAAYLIDKGVLEGKTIGVRSEEHTSELQSLMRISYAVFCLKKKQKTTKPIKKRIEQ